MGRRAVSLLFLALATMSCGRGAKWQAYFHEDPIPYYLYLPEGRSDLDPAPLFVGLLGSGGSAADCFDLWQPLAKDRDLALICPELAGGEDLHDNIQAERDLGTVLTDVYAQHTFRPRFFVAGFGDAGRFVLDYTLQFPQVISGAAAMAVDEFPAVNAAGLDMPFLIALGQDDRARQSVVAAAEAAWKAQGLVVRVVSIGGDDREPTLDFARLAAELCVQTSR